MYMSLAVLYNGVMVWSFNGKVLLWYIHHCVVNGDISLFISLLLFCFVMVDIQFR